ncbi:MAG: hypothetical protein ACI9EF_002651 [Pseudohongiellaceae bacterium]|jgi:hypothetical protein
MLNRPTALLSVLCLVAASLAPASAQTIVLNTKQVGFVPLPGSSFTTGLWSYESPNGKRYCLQTHLNNGLYIIETTDSANPTLVRTVPGNFRKVQVFQNYAYVTTDTGPTVVIDLTNPATASKVGQWGIGAHTLRVDDSNGRLYLNRTSSLYIYDLLANPISPPLLGIWSGGAHDCRPDGDTVYVNGSQAGPTRILDVSNPQTPMQIGDVGDGNHSSALYFPPTGETILLACDESTGGFLTIYDVSNPSQPLFLSEYKANQTQKTSVHNVEVKGAYAYLGYYLDQLRILDLRDPSNPVEVGIWDNNPNNTGFWWDDAWESIPHHDAIYMNQQLNTPASPKGLFTIDFFPAFGSASDGTGAVQPELWWSFGPPSPGNDDFAMRLTNAKPNAPAWLVLGASNTSWGPVPLPLTLTNVGAPNAQLFVSGDVFIPVTTDGNGEAVINLPIPAGLQYGTYYAQWAVKDTGAPNAGGWALSKAGELVLK